QGWFYVHFSKVDEVFVFMQHDSMGSDGHGLCKCTTCGFQRHGLYEIEIPTL
ncbi:hypothetical protein CROQUDRAFT_39327, partial [Cronartium quercuum f. sp. fusiforme G11]